MKKQVTVFLEPSMKMSAEAGEHNFLSKVAAVLRDHKFEVAFSEEANRHAHLDGYALVHMKPPMTDKTLVMRRVYAYPFWAIEASDKRWEWRVAKARFAPEEIDRKKARKFVENWRTRLFGSGEIRREGFVYIPLQGRLGEKRSFQETSPLTMIEAVLEEDGKRKIIAGLHPKESYSDEELSKLEELERRFSRLSIVTGEMDLYLRNCDYVVSQNSSAAFFGYFFSKPAALFGKIDFHHIAANVSALGISTALKQAPELAPDYERYLWWFWQERSINAGRPDAEAQIEAVLRNANWIK